MKRLFDIVVASSALLLLSPLFIVIAIAVTASVVLLFPRINLSDEQQVELLKKISPITHVTARSAPTLIIHGNADMLVPIQQSESFVKKMKEAGVPAELVVKRGAGHGWLTMKDDIGTLADWFDKYLRKKP